MISQIKGTLLTKGPNFLILENNGLGFKVFVTPAVLEKTQENKPLTLHTFLAVKETALDLYGFLDKEELKYFELLISISGIGPKGALGILAVSSPESIKDSVLSSDHSLLTKVSGIGQKTAQKIILELKTRLEKEFKNAPGKTLEKADLEVIEALHSLGYNEKQARSALQKIGSKGKDDVSTRIKKALRALSK